MRPLGALVAVLVAVSVVAVLLSYVWSSGSSGSGVSDIESAPPTTKPFLYFRPVDCVIPNYKPLAYYHFDTAQPWAGVCSNPNAEGIPTSAPSADSAAATVILPNYAGSFRFVLGPADLNQTAIANTSVIQERSGGYAVRLTFTRMGATALDAMAAQRYRNYQSHPGGPYPYSSSEAVDLDGVVEWNPIVEVPTFNGTVLIGGTFGGPFTEKQAEDLAQLIAVAKYCPGTSPVCGSARATVGKQ
jgi:hypothetical protein